VSWGDNKEEWNENLEDFWKTGDTMPNVNISVNLPAWIHQPLRRVKHAFMPPRNGQPGINLAGDRDIEYSFVAAHLPSGPGEALDFGCGPSNLSLLAGRRGFRVLALDLMPQAFFWEHEGVRFRQADLLETDLPGESLDLVVNCSAVEHVGLVGRYGVSKDQTDGDLAVMQRLLFLLRENGTMLLTIPCGRDAVFAPVHRVYGERRLPELLRGYAIEKEEYWIKDAANRWNISSREATLQFEPKPPAPNPTDSSYGLACFVLRKPGLRSPNTPK